MSQCIHLQLNKTSATIVDYMNCHAGLHVHGGYVLLQVGNEPSISSAKA